MVRDVGAQRRNPSSKISGPNYGPNSRELVLKVYKNTETMLRGIVSAMNTEGKKTTA